MKGDAGGWSVVEVNALSGVGDRDGYAACRNPAVVISTLVFGTNGER